MKVNKLNKLKQLIRDTERSRIYDNVVSLIVFGSQIYNKGKIANDADFCIVLRKKKKNDLRLISKLFKKYYHNLDITIYYQNELSNLLPFRDIGTGCFAMHYFATGKPLIGKNIFVEKYKKLPQSLYKQSLREKMFDYLLRLRRAFIIYESKQEMIAYLEKYTSRLLIDLMVYNQPNLLPSIIKNFPEKIFQRAKRVKIITRIPAKTETKKIKDYLHIIEEITNQLLRLK